MDFFHGQRRHRQRYSDQKRRTQDRADLIAMRNSALRDLRRRPASVERGPRPFTAIGRSHRQAHNQKDELSIKRLNSELRAAMTRDRKYPVAAGFLPLSSSFGPGPLYGDPTHKSPLGKEEQYDDRRCCRRRAAITHGQLVEYVPRIKPSPATGVPHLVVDVDQGPM